jgi:1-deoxy-D-xylulose-5-phosphate synthase
MPAILPTLHGPEGLRELDQAELRSLCREIRATIIETVATTGGHLGSSLGAVELAVALHRVLQSPRDRIVWDTGHQAYAHKLLTGRYESFGTLRQLDGIGGFPRRSESPHDVFDGGHAGTGLSIAQGLATARDLRGQDHRIAVVVGDAALISGLALEALNDIGHRRPRLLIVLNDNEMSISRTVGALSVYLSRIKLSRTWNTLKLAYDETVRRVPVIGRTLLELSRRFRKSIVNFAQPGQLFEDLGITYIGPINGHDLGDLERTFRRALQLPDPVLVHVRTQKGRGYPPAVADQVNFHGAALPPITLLPGRLAAVNGEGEGEARLSDAQAAAARRRPPAYSAVMAEELMAIAEDDPRVVAVTAAMPTGTGLNRFGAAFPARFIDVGICEPHAVTMATGLAIGGMRPFVAIYSTFLQRALDAQIHDVCQNDQPVVIGVDRAGLVGEDGTSHQGIFTVPAQRQIPHMVVASPKDEQELRSLLRTAFAQDHPFALHYPRDPTLDLPPVAPRLIPVGEGELLRDGSDLLVVGFGPIVQRGLATATALDGEGWSTAVVNARFASPLDADLIVRHARGKQLIVTLEESVSTGGFGSAVLEALARAGLDDAALRTVPTLVVGVPAGRFIDHGPVADLRRLARLDEAGIMTQVREALARVGATPSRTPAAVRSA